MWRWLGTGTSFKLAYFTLWWNWNSDWVFEFNTMFIMLGCLNDTGINNLKLQHYIIHKLRFHCFVFCIIFNWRYSIFRTQDDFRMIGQDLRKRYLKSYYTEKNLLLRLFAEWRGRIYPHSEPPRIPLSLHIACTFRKHPNVIDVCKPVKDIKQEKSNRKQVTGCNIDSVT